MSLIVNKRADPLPWSWGQPISVGLNSLPPGAGWSHPNCHKSGILVCLLQLGRHIYVKTLIYWALRKMHKVHKCRFLPLFWPPETADTGRTKLWWKCQELDQISQWISSFPFPSMRNHLSLVVFFFFHGGYPLTCWLYVYHPVWVYSVSPYFDYVTGFFPQKSLESGNWLG